jgi:hypothetical protein
MEIIEFSSGGEMILLLAKNKSNLNKILFSRMQMNQLTSHYYSNELNLL